MARKRTTDAQKLLQYGLVDSWGAAAMLGVEQHQFKKYRTACFKKAHPNYPQPPEPTVTLGMCPLYEHEKIVEYAAKLSAFRAQRIIEAQQLITI